MRNGKKYVFQKMTLLLLLVLILGNFFLVSKPYTVWADEKTKSEESSRSDDSWLNGSNESIYEGETGTEAIELEEEKSDDEAASLLGGLVIDFLCEIGDGVNTLFKSIGIDLDTVILGRVGGHGIIMDGKRISLFTFDMNVGNPYGVVAMFGYGVIRGIAYIIIALVVFGKVVATSFGGGGTKALGTLKESLKDLAIGIVLLSIMPNILEVALYIRDVILSVLMGAIQSSMGLDMSELSLVDTFKDISHKSIMNANMYLGVLIINLWFAFQYVGVAMSFVVNVFAFPFICASMQIDKKALGQWGKNVLSYLVVPIGDLILMFIPLIIAHINTNLKGGPYMPLSVVQLLVCASIIPARSALRVALGLSPHMGMELAGMATLMGAAAMAKGAVGTTMSVANEVKGAKNDEKMAEMYGEMGKEYESGFNGPKGTGYQVDEDGVIDVGFSTSSDGMVGGSTSRAEPEEVSKILDKYANVDNFEDSEFSGISNKKKAELYKERAKNRKKKAAFMAAGGAAGLAAGTGAGMFLSPGSHMAMVGGMASAGSSLGGMASNLKNPFSKKDDSASGGNVQSEVIPPSGDINVFEPGPEYGGALGDSTAGSLPNFDSVYENGEVTDYPGIGGAWNQPPEVIYGETVTDDGTLYSNGEVADANTNMGNERSNVSNRGSNTPPPPPSMGNGRSNVSNRGSNTPPPPPSMGNGRSNVSNNSRGFTNPGAMSAGFGNIPSSPNMSNVNGLDVNMSGKGVTNGSMPPPPSINGVNMPSSPNINSGAGPKTTFTRNQTFDATRGILDLSNLSFTREETQQIVDYTKETMQATGFNSPEEMKSSYIEAFSSSKAEMARQKMIESADERIKQMQQSNPNYTEEVDRAMVDVSVNTLENRYRRQLEKKDDSWWLRRNIDFANMTMGDNNTVKYRGNKKEK